MFVDALLQLEKSRTDVRAANTYKSENTIDLSVSRDIGANGGLTALWNVEAPYAGGTSIQFQQIISANADLSSADVIDAGITVPLAQLVAGALVARPVPPLLASPQSSGAGGIGYTGKRYYGHQEVSLGIFTGGAHSSRLVTGVVNVKHHASGWTIA